MNNGVVVVTLLAAVVVMLVSIGSAFDFGTFNDALELLIVIGYSVSGTVGAYVAKTCAARVHARQIRQLFGFAVIGGGVSGKLLL